MWGAGVAAAACVGVTAAALAGVDAVGPVHAHSHSANAAPAAIRSTQSRRMVALSRIVGLRRIIISAPATVRLEIESVINVEASHAKTPTARKHHRQLSA